MNTTSVNRLPAYNAVIGERYTFTSTFFGYLSSIFVNGRRGTYKGGLYGILECDFNI